MIKKMLVTGCLLFSSYACALPQWKIVEQSLIAARQACMKHHNYCAVAFVDSSLQPFALFRFLHASHGVLGYAKSNAVTSLIYNADTSQLLSQEHIDSRHIDQLKFLNFTIAFFPGGYRYVLNNQNINFGVGVLNVDGDTKLAVADAILKTLNSFNGQTKNLPKLAKITKQDMATSISLLSLASVSRGLEWCDAKKLGCSIAIGDTEGDLSLLLSNDAASRLSALVATRRLAGVVGDPTLTYSPVLNKRINMPLTYNSLGRKVQFMPGGIALKYDSMAVASLGVAINLKRHGTFPGNKTLKYQLENVVKSYFEKHYDMDSCHYRQSSS